MKKSLEKENCFTLTFASIPKKIEKKKIQNKLAWAFFVLTFQNYNEQWGAEA